MGPVYLSRVIAGGDSARRGPSGRRITKHDRAPGCGRDCEGRSIDLRRFQRDCRFRPLRGLPPLFCGPVRFAQPALAASPLQRNARVIDAQPDDARSTPPFGVGRSTLGVRSPAPFNAWAAAEHRRIRLSCPRNCGGRDARPCPPSTRAEADLTALPIRRRFPRRPGRLTWETWDGLHLEVARCNEVREEPP